VLVVTPGPGRVLTRTFVGLGANLGDAAATLRWAAGELGRLGRVRLSSLWLSAPVGPIADQPWFVNAVAELDTELDPRALVRELQAIEARAGRDRAREMAQGPRALDLDLLVHGAAVVREPDLVVPHPRLAERAFALAPLEELVGPDHVIPGAGRVGPLLERALATQAIAKMG
jgi:2-amino-4-hydroxy-6-hydroxymethyldihydropteridine diphosphokinase